MPAERSRPTLICAFACVGWLLALTAPALAAPAGEPYGLISASPNMMPGEGFAERSANYRRLYEAGVRAVRIDIPWTLVEPVGRPVGDFDFTVMDREVAAIKAAGLGVIGLLAYGHPDHSALGGLLQQTTGGGGVPPFGISNAGLVPPDDPRDFATYAGAVAAHYGDEVIAWEVWNEQNEGWRFWFPREDPRAYARLLCEAHRRLKEADPATPVVYGGLFFAAVAELPGMSAPTFLEATYAADPTLGRCFDVLAYHPYPYPFTSPEVDVPGRGSVLSAAEQMRSVLARHGDLEKPLWITEIGWPTHERAYGVTEAKQAEYLPRMLVASFAGGVPVVSWFAYGDTDDPSGANQEAHFGLFRPDNSPKPAYGALRVFSETFRGAAFARDRSRELGLPPGAQFSGGRGLALEYERGQERLTALWLAGETASEAQGPGSRSTPTTEVALPVRSPRVTVVGHLGERRELRAERGEVRLTIGSAPLYVIDAPAAARTRLLLRHRRGRTRGGARCARPPVRVRVAGPAGRSAAFAVDGRTVARDSRPPLEARVRRGLERPGVHSIRARVVLQGGGVVSLARRLRTCGT